jgi:hypothetical protein
MTAVPLPQPVAAPACHARPDQWFDAAARPASLRACLACTYRRSCAQRALQLQPTDGMWAGVWISGNFNDAAPVLTSIATTSDTRGRRVRPEANDAAKTATVAATTSPPPPAPTAETYSLRARRPSASPEAPRSLVLARSSGHCEVMAPGCALTAHDLALRLAGREIDDAALLYAVCRPCVEVVQSLDAPIARRLGYTLASTDTASTAPFLWRQAHRVLFDSGGGLSAVVRHPRLESRAK